jgi:hypothetical protein
MTYLNLVFFFPYRGAGGVPAQFLTIAQYLLRSGYPREKLFLIDFADGYMSTHAKGIQILIAKEGKELSVPEKSIIILQARGYWTLPSNLIIPDNTLVLFWALHPLNMSLLEEREMSPKIFDRLISGILRCVLFQKRNKLIKQIQLSLSHNALFFMDGEVRKHITKNINNKIGFKLLPVSIDVDSIPKQDALRNTNDHVINIGWLGRIGDMKTQTILYLIDNLSAAASRLQNKIIFHLIGDGPAMVDVEKRLSESSGTYFDYRCLGTLYSEKMYKYITENIDLMFAMGLSGLESCAMRIPTLLVPIIYENISGYYNYNYYYKNRDFTLGEILNNSHYFEREPTLDSILNDFKINKEIHAKKCYTYVKNNHDISILSDEIISAVSNCSLTSGELIDEGLKNFDLVSRFFHGIKYGKWNGMASHHF